MSHGLGQAFSVLNFQKYLWTLTHLAAFSIEIIAENMCTIIIVRYNFKLKHNFLGKAKRRGLMRGYLIAHPVRVDRMDDQSTSQPT